ISRYGGVMCLWKSSRFAVLDDEGETVQCQWMHEFTQLAQHCGLLNKDGPPPFQLARVLKALQRRCKLRINARMGISFQHSYDNGCGKRRRDLGMRYKASSVRDNQT